MSEEEKSLGRLIYESAVEEQKRYARLNAEELRAFLAHKASLESGRKWRFLNWLLCKRFTQDQLANEQLKFMRERGPIMTRSKDLSPLGKEPRGE